MTEAPRAHLRGPVFVVTGMHRSATSLVARAVNLLGVSLGDPASLMPPGPDNPAGYWENRYVKELDDEVFARLGGSWDRPPVLAPGWETSSDLDPFRQRAADIVERDLGQAEGPVAFKDPRLSLLLPFWRSVVDIETTVLVVRDPREVVGSLHARNGMGTAQAAALWLRYVLGAMADDPSHLLVRQSEVLGDAPGTLRTIAAHLGVPAPSTAVVEAVAAHVDPGLIHHSAGPATAPDHDPTLALAMAVWADGAVNTDAVGTAAIVEACLRQGWLGPPANREEATSARAEASGLREQLRRRNRLVEELRARVEILTAKVREAEASGASGAGATGSRSGDDSPATNEQVSSAR